MFRRFLALVALNLTILLFIPAISFSQSTNDEAKTLVEFTKFLREEAHNHREFLEGWYNRTAAALTALAAVVGAALVFLNYRSRSEIRRAVEARFQTTAATLIEERMREFDQQIADSRRRVEEQFRKLNFFLLDMVQPEKAGRGSARERLADLKILWVDDFPENNAYPREILEQAGAQISIARSTQDAQATLAKEGINTFNVVISDMSRGRNPTAGLELLNELKRQGFRGKCLIYASSRAVQQYGQQARALGATETVSGVSELLNAIAKLANQPF